MDNESAQQNRPTVGQRTMDSPDSCRKECLAARRYRLLMRSESRTPIPPSMGTGGIPPAGNWSA